MLRAQPTGACSECPRMSENVRSAVIVSISRAVETDSASTKGNATMAYWLLKTEPSTYSYDDLARDKKTTWDGVTNATALKNIRAMKKGDLALVYHTGDVRAVVGIAEIASAPYADPRQDHEKLVVV